MHRLPRAAAIGMTAALLAVTALPAAADTPHDTTHLLFVTSARENPQRTEVTYPLHKGTSHGKDVYYVITDTSDRGMSAVLGVNYAPKIANAKGTAAVQTVSVDGFVGILDFPA